MPSPLGNSCKMVFIHHLHHWFFPTYFPISHTSPYFSHVALSISVQEILNGLWISTSARFFMVFAASGLVGCGCPLSFLENIHLCQIPFISLPRILNVVKSNGKGQAFGFYRFLTFFPASGRLGWFWQLPPLAFEECRASPIPLELCFSLGNPTKWHSTWLFPSGFPTFFSDIPFISTQRTLDGNEWKKASIRFFWVFDVFSSFWATWVVLAAAPSGF